MSQSICSFLICVFIFFSFYIYILDSQFHSIEQSKNSASCSGVREIQNLKPEIIRVCLGNLVWLISNLSYRKKDASATNLFCNKFVGKKICHLMFLKISSVNNCVTKRKLCHFLPTIFLSVRYFVYLLLLHNKLGLKCLTLFT